MPSVNIWEKDLTSSGQTSYDNFVVLVPGLYSNLLWGQDFTIRPAKRTTVEVEPVIVKSATFASFSELLLGKGKDEDLGDKEKAARKALLGTYGYQVVEKLTRELGMTVLYGPITQKDNAGNVIPGDLDLLDEYSSYFQKFEDRGLYDIRFITTGGYTTAKSAECAINCAARRGDAVALIDCPDTYTPESSGLEPIEYKLDNAKNIEIYLESLEVSPVSRTIMGTNTQVIENAFSYGAAFAPAFKYGRKAPYSFEYGSFGYLAAFSKHINRFPEWFAMAGSIRGVLPYDNVEPSIKFSSADVNEILTTRDGDKRACNPICEVRPYGNIIYGNRTMYYLTKDEIDEYGTGLRASHFLNIRQLCCTLKKVVYRSARRFLFEPNTDVLWVNFCESIRPTLELMKTSQGIRGYSIRREPAAIKGLLRAVITIKPIEAVEDFDIGVELSDSVEIYE